LIYGGITIGVTGFIRREEVVDDNIVVKVIHVFVDTTIHLVYLY
jgi:hypothetical protein